MAFLGLIFDNSVAPKQANARMRTLYEATHCSQLIHEPEAQARVWWIGFEFFESCRMATSDSSMAN